MVALRIVNKKLVFQLKASLTKAEDANASLQVLVTKLESKNKAERILHPTAKNAMAEAQSSIELYIEGQADRDSESLGGLHNAAVGLQHELCIIWRSLQIA